MGTDVGAMIRRARIDKHLSQKEVADRTHLKQSSISSIEGGHSKPSLETAARIAAVLGIDMNELCGLKRPQKNVSVDGLESSQIVVIESMVSEYRILNAKVKK